MIILAYNRKMNRNSEPGEKLTKTQAHSKRNSSNIFETETANNKNTNKIAPEKPFNFEGKDIYVIDNTNDGDNADVQIIQNDQYEDRSAFLSKTSWPLNVGNQFEMLNGKFEDSSNSGARSVRTSTRSKSSNPLDHFIHDNKNANREVSPSGTHSKYSLRRRKYLLFRNIFW